MAQLLATYEGKAIAAITPRQIAADAAVRRQRAISGRRSIVVSVRMGAWPPRIRGDEQPWHSFWLHTRGRRLSPSRPARSPPPLPSDASAQSPDDDRSLFLFAWGPGLHAESNRYRQGSIRREADFSYARSACDSCRALTQVRPRAPLYRLGSIRREADFSYARSACDSCRALTQVRPRAPLYRLGSTHFHCIKA